jgi:putative glycosyltransferase (TIGR04348 family)
LRSLEYDVTVAESDDGNDHDVLIALHARRSAKSVVDFQSRLPGCPVIVAMTGTDLHHDLGRNPIVEATLQRADRIVLLEPEGGRNKLKPELQKKSHVIFQSSVPISNPPLPLDRFFEVSVLGHLRPIKDPFRAAQAARMLPASSRVRVVHFGEALSADMQRRARLESERNFRYRWFGPVSHREALRRLARSRLTVLSSKAEGGSSVISEAITNNVPVLASRNDASIGMLGGHHPGLFNFGDTEELAALMNRSEQDSGFYRELLGAGRRLKPRFTVEAEIRAWKRLVREISEQ